MTMIQPQVAMAALKSPAAGNVSSGPSPSAASSNSACKEVELTFASQSASNAIAASGKTPPSVMAAGQAMGGQGTGLPFIPDTKPGGRSRTLSPEEEAKLLEDSKWDPAEAERLKKKAEDSIPGASSYLMHSKQVQEFYKEVWTFLRNLWRRTTHQDMDKRDPLMPEEKAWMSEMEPILKKINFTEVHRDNFRIRFQEILTGTRANLNQRPKNPNAPRPHASGILGRTTPGQMMGPFGPMSGIPQALQAGRMMAPNGSPRPLGPPGARIPPPPGAPGLHHMSPGGPFAPPPPIPGTGSPFVAQGIMPPVTPGSVASPGSAHSPPVMSHGQQQCAKVLEEVESFRTSKGMNGIPLPVLFQHVMEVFKILVDHASHASRMGQHDPFPKAWCDTFMELRPMEFFEAHQFFTIQREVDAIARLADARKRPPSALQANNGGARKRSRLNDTTGPWDGEATLCLVCDLVDLLDSPSPEDQDRMFPELLNFIRTCPDARMAQTVRPLSQQLSKFRPEQQAELVDAWSRVGYSITLPEPSHHQNIHSVSTASSVTHPFSRSPTGMTVKLDTPWAEKTPSTTTVQVHPGAPPAVYAGTPRLGAPSPGASVTPPPPHHPTMAEYGSLSRGTSMANFAVQRRM